MRIEMSREALERIYREARERLRSGDFPHDEDLIGALEGAFSEAEQREIESRIVARHGPKAMLWDLAFEALDRWRTKNPNDLVRRYLGNLSAAGVEVVAPLEDDGLVGLPRKTPKRKAPQKKQKPKAPSVARLTLEEESEGFDFWDEQANPASLPHTAWQESSSLAGFRLGRQDLKFLEPWPDRSNPPPTRNKFWLLGPDGSATAVPLPEGHYSGGALSPDARKVLANHLDKNEILEADLSDGGVKTLWSARSTPELHPFLVDYAADDHVIFFTNYPTSEIVLLARKGDDLTPVDRIPAPRGTTSWKPALGGTIFVVDGPQSLHAVGVRGGKVALIAKAPYPQEPGRRSAYVNTRSGGRVFLRVDSTHYGNTTKQIYRVAGLEDAYRTAFESE